MAACYLSVCSIVRNRYVAAVRAETNDSLLIHLTALQVACQQAAADVAYTVAYPGGQRAGGVNHS